MRSSYAYRKEWYTDIINKPDTYRTEPFCMCGNLFFAGTKDSSSIIVDTGQGLLLFDTGYPNMQDYLFESMEKLGFDVRDIRMIFHTHAHFDHFGATKRLKEQSGAITCMSRIDAELLRDDPEMALCDYMPQIETDVFVPDRELEDGEEITCGITKVICHLTGGHTPGAMSYEITVRDGEKEYTALLCGGVGFNTLNRTFIKETGYNWRPAFERSLKIWKQMSPDIFLGNHTPQSLTLERKEQGLSFVDKNAWPEYIAKIEQDYNKMRKEEG